MKHRIVFFSCILVLSTMSTAQLKPRHSDPVDVSPDKFSVLLENDHVRVVEYRLEPGEKDAWHTHPPKVSYVVSGGRLRITPRGEDSFVVEEQTGSAAWMGAVGPHFGENIGNTLVHITIVELKSLGDTPFAAIGVEN